MEKKEPKRILHVVSAMGRGGTESLIMNIYRNIDHANIQFDFITHRQADYDEEIRSLGGELFYIPSLGEIGPIKYIRKLRDIMSHHPYIAIHAHTDYQSGIPAFAAKICGIKKRICHSHSNNWPKQGVLKEKLMLKILQLFIKFFATNLCSCSEEAAAFLFGPRNHNKVKILKNGINLCEYINKDGWNRKSVLKELNLADDAVLLGHVGRFSESKNHLFLLKVLKTLVEEDDRFVAVLVGDGPLRASIEEEAQRQGMVERIRFLGVRADIPRLMNAFDAFFFPSSFEGFGIVMIEAQSAGTPCIASASVPKETDMGLGLVKYISLHESIEIWTKEIQSSLLMPRLSNIEIIENIKKLGFHIQDNIQDWLALYGIEVQQDEEKNLNHFV
ncbi:putative glycosyltransferase EpsF [Bacillus sp. J14TS2]|uniref:glycosyltransferase family 1 protein n=1 Tax=Bacillus sp. J14TS2 TaxID=2807188 RepID=UPI001B25F168|nr:glycosyltransferase family 1 protein [Bacillus sp. J14TS2]GIN73225.1 putative glycosyltransferase EpsF [Bacillus sp. J14TS2]